MSGPKGIGQRLGATLRGLVFNENGATAIEYALIASLLSMAVVGSAFLLGGGVADLWAHVRDEVVAGLAL